MKFHIDKQSEVKPHEQLREQILFLIGTGQLAIGEEMPSVRALSCQLGLSINTISKVYSELAHANWLVERHGAHHIVVGRKDSAITSRPVADLDDLIDRTITLAQSHGYSLQQLAARMRGRLMEHPPDYFLVVSPEQGIGEVMREEIHEKIGYSPPSCGIQLLQQNPAMGIGAILITPTYVVDTLAFAPPHRRRVLPVAFAPLDALIELISKLPHPSMIGLLSVSGAGLKTVSGIVAPAIGKRHSIHLFLMERPDPEIDRPYRIRRYGLQEYQPADILKPRAAESDAPEAHLEQGHNESTVSAADLRCMDLLACDVITFALIDHPRRFKCRLLTEESLNKIQVEAAALPRVTGTNQREANPGIAPV
jgi:DNA-binding transcriptional regulator YhcF (GntR family)